MQHPETDQHGGHGDEERVAADLAEGDKQRDEDPVEEERAQRLPHAKQEKRPGQNQQGCLNGTPDGGAAVCVAVRSPAGLVDLGVGAQDDVSRVLVRNPCGGLANRQPRARRDPFIPLGHGIALSGSASGRRCRTCEWSRPRCRKVQSTVSIFGATHLRPDAGLLLHLARRGFAKTLAGLDVSLGQRPVSVRILDDESMPGSGQPSHHHSPGCCARLRRVVQPCVGSFTAVAI